MSNSCIPDKNEKPTEEEWGGDIKECIGGPFKSITGSFSFGYAPLLIDQGNNVEYEIQWPAKIIFPAINGYRSNEFKIGPIFSGNIRHSTAPTANYFTDIEEFPFTEDCINCPAFLFPDYTKRTQGGFYNLLGYPYFTLECLDSDDESKHKIHLTIREWNTKEEFLSFKDTDGGSGDPDFSGTEGNDCNYYESDEMLSNTACNDYLDLDDYKAQDIYPNVKYDSSGS